MPKQSWKWTRGEDGTYTSDGGRFTVKRGGWSGNKWIAFDNGEAVGRERKGKWMEGTYDAEGKWVPGEYDENFTYIEPTEFDTKTEACGYCEGKAYREEYAATMTGRVESVTIPEWERAFMFGVEGENTYLSRVGTHDAQVRVSNAADAMRRAQYEYEDAVRDMRREYEEYVNALRQRLNKYEPVAHKHEDGTEHAHANGDNRQHDHGKDDV